MYGNTGMWDIYNPLMAQEWADTDKRIREYETVKEMYPESMQFIAQCVSDECDKYEYAASFIYDEYPDRFQLERMVKRIEKKVREEDALVQKEGDSVEDIQATSLNLWMMLFEYCCIMKSMGEDAEIAGVDGNGIK